MKMPNVKSKKFIISTVVSAALLTSAGFAAATMVPNTTPTVKTTQAKVIDAPAKTEVPTEVIESTPEVIAPAPAQEPAPEPVDNTPAVPSIDELGATYLRTNDSPKYKACLDEIVAYMPDLFTDENREKSIKILAARSGSTAALCTYDNSPYGQQLHLDTTEGYIKARY